ncbi:MAG: HAD hydrolase-like protein, partial [Isosphaeraceae bacterium]
TWRENVETVLAASDLLAAFELIVGKEDVGSVKPDPEAYLLALSRLGLSAGETVAIEEFRASPSAIVANSADGSAMPPTSPVSSPYLGSYGTWGLRREA